MRKITIEVIRELVAKFPLSEEEVVELLERLDIDIPEEVKEQLE